MICSPLEKEAESEDFGEVGENMRWKLTLDLASEYKLICV